MMNSKNKGNTFERKISKLLSERFAEKTGLESSFRRNIDSGAYFGGLNVSRAQTHDTTKATFGDIICPEGFLFNIECKHYKSPPSFNVLLKQEYKQWDNWLSQADQDSKSASLRMLVIIKYNGIDEFVFLSEKLEGDEPLFVYKDYFAYTLKHFLSKPDTFYFVN